jgi:hypothetical protein
MGAGCAGLGLLILAIFAILFTLAGRLARPSTSQKSSGSSRRRARCSRRSPSRSTSPGALSWVSLVMLGALLTLLTAAAG